MRTKASHSRGQTRRTLRHPRKYLSLKVAARRAGLSVTTMYQWAKKGQTSSGTPIQVVKDDLRNQLLISEDSLIALLANRYTLLQPA
jgi:hypothetical protein